MEGREGEIRWNRLYQASLSGNVDTLNELMNEDPLTLARACITCFDETPLHIAAMLGHVDFAAALVRHKPDLVTKPDSRGHSPLHLASANGYVEIVKLLLVDTAVCLTPDEDGRTPFHLAVMHDQDKVINELVRAQPEAIVSEFNRGENLLHSCVEHNRLKALKLLVETGRVDDFINVKDHDGNTILHMATSLMRLEVIKSLLSRPRVELNEVNANGFTALDIIEHMPRVLKSVKIHEALQRAGALPALAHDSQRTTRESEISPGRVVNLEAVAPPSHPQGVAVAQPPTRRGSIEEHLKKHEDWLEKKRDALLIAATVIAGMSYQATLNPPGGVWQGEGNYTRGGYHALDFETKPYHAGESVIAYSNSSYFHLFWLCNTVSFTASLSIVFLLLSGIPLKRRLFMWILMITAWVTLTFMALAYCTSVYAISPQDDDDATILGVIWSSRQVWFGLLAIVLLVHIVRFIIWSVRKVFKLGKWLFTSVTCDGGNVEMVYNARAA